MYKVKFNYKGQDTIIGCSNDDTMRQICDKYANMINIDIDDDTWNRNIEERNKRIEEGNGGSDFYMDEGLLNKLLSMFETPDKAEIDVWYELNR